MTAARMHKRQMKLLKDLARMGEYRADRKTPMNMLASDLTVQGYVGGKKFVDKAAPCFEGGSTKSYDLNCLVAAGYIDVCYLSQTQDSSGSVVYSEPGVRLTQEGLAQVRELERWWLSKAIERQPITAIQVVVALAQIAWAVLLAYWSWNVAHK